jgi:hypothetical protein
MAARVASVSNQPSRRGRSFVAVRESETGTKRTCRSGLAMSAVEGRTDICSSEQTSNDSTNSLVRIGSCASRSIAGCASLLLHLADVRALANDRFAPEAALYPESLRQTIKNKGHAGITPHGLCETVPLGPPEIPSRGA